MTLGDELQVETLKTLRQVVLTHVLDQRDLSHQIEIKIKKLPYESATNEQTKKKDLATQNLDDILNSVKTIYPLIHNLQAESRQYLRTILQDEIEDNIIE